MDDVLEELAKCRVIAKEMMGPLGKLDRLIVLLDSMSAHVKEMIAIAKEYEGQLYTCKD